MCPDRVSWWEEKEGKCVIWKQSYHRNLTQFPNWVVDYWYYYLQMRRVEAFVFVDICIYKWGGQKYLYFLIFVFVDEADRSITSNSTWRVGLADCLAYQDRSPTSNPAQSILPFSFFNTLSGILFGPQSDHCLASQLDRKIIFLRYEIGKGLRLVLSLPLIVPHSITRSVSLSILISLRLESCHSGWQE